VKIQIFPKLHVLIAHVVDFIACEGMFGAVSEESFEACHLLIKKAKCLVNRIADIALRADVLSRRLQQ
jgi:hypothetical protein